MNETAKDAKNAKVKFLVLRVLCALRGSFRLGSRFFALCSWAGRRLVAEVGSAARQLVVGHRSLDLAADRRSAWVLALVARLALAARLGRSYSHPQ